MSAIALDNAGVTRQLAGTGASVEVIGACLRMAAHGVTIEAALDVTQLAALEDACRGARLNLETLGLTRWG